MSRSHVALFDLRLEVLAEVASITPYDDLEQAHLTEAMDWIWSGAELCRLAKPATPPRHLVSYFLLQDGDHFLLVDHINAGLWLPTGGHVDPGEHPRGTVVREAREELGIEARFVTPRPVFLSVTETVGRTAGHWDVSLWYLLAGRRDAVLVFDCSEFTQVRWFGIDDVPYHRSDPHLKRVLSKLAADPNRQAQSADHRADRAPVRM